MSPHTETSPQAIDCRHLRRTIDAGRLDGPVICLCDHPIRAGFDCVGPFIEDLATDCQLWEEKPDAANGSTAVRR